ncbi:MAG: serine/threonine-protein kinase [Gaiellaceae bacterium]
MLPPGTVVGSYRLEAFLGSGAMGAVYKARGDHQETDVALKLMRAELMDDPTFRRRFDREGDIASRLNHPNLVSVLDRGEADGFLYLATRFVDGLSLREWLSITGSLPLDELGSIAADLASGLDELHSLGITHRDIKPANVVIGVDGTALLTDFGLARAAADTVLTRAGHVFGTVDYLAPELIRGERGTGASDIYSLGCLVYACACGAPPFAGLSVTEACVAHVSDPPPNPQARREDLPEAFSWALLTALTKEPRDRPQTATAYAHLLRASLSP